VQADVQSAVQPNLRQLPWSEQFFEALRLLRVCLLAPVLVFVTLALPPQVHDLYRTLAEGRNWPQIAATVLLLLLAAYLTYRAGRHRALVREAYTRRGEGAFLRACLRWGPAVCAALLLAAVAGGIYFTASELPEPKGIDEEIDKTLAKMGGTRRELVIAAATLAGAGLLFLLFPLVEAWRRRGAPARPPSAFAFSALWQVLAVAVACAMVGMVFFPMVSIPVAQGLGSLAVFLIFLSVLLVVLSTLQTWSDRQGIPWLFLLLLWPLGLAIFEGGTTHYPRFVDTPSKGVGLIQVQYALVDWYRDRKDKDAYANVPYPVYLIAAEGGGLYAAQFTANVLARLQDICPNFAQHVFAISSVSGGSLGASVFSSLAKKHARNGPWEPCKVGPTVFQDKVRKILNQDFLAPIVARAFFADILQVFLPRALLVPQFSRGRALEESIEHAWAQVEGEANNPFSAPFLSHWRSDDAGPALLLNTTSVNDGRQVVVTPMGSDTNVVNEAGQLHLVPGFPTDQDLTLGAAVGLSGRFPWILPVATIGDTGLALVDGAYFEGSGVEALSMVRNALRQFEVKPTGPGDTDPYISVHVIVIGSVKPPAGALLSIDEVTPPLRTMLLTRERRGYIAFNNMRDFNLAVQCPPVRPQAMIAAQLEGGAVHCASPPPQVARLNYEYFKLPLGWQLSHGMRSIIERHSMGRCFEPGALAAPDAPLDEELEQAREYLTQNSLLPVEVANHLSAGRAGGDGGLKACE
jgi:cytochrome bd-type quinol oxidase subunit 2